MTSYYQILKWTKRQRKQVKNLETRLRNAKQGLENLEKALILAETVNEAETVVNSL